MKDTLETAYRHERERILGWMKPRVGAEAAEDILHDVIVRSLINLDSLEGVRDITAWLWRSARNAVIDAWRARARRGRTDELDDLLDTALETAEDLAEREEILAALAGAIRALPEPEREVIVAQGLSGVTFQALSKRTGVKPGTLAARKRSALAKLRASLGRYRN